MGYILIEFIKRGIIFITCLNEISRNVLGIIIYAQCFIKAVVKNARYRFSKKYSAWHGNGYR